MEVSKGTITKNSTAVFFALVNNPFKLKFYLLKNLPAAFFSGLKIVRADDRECIVSIPYKWFTKNPFRSTYFASLSMAAEFSTGVLAMANVYSQTQAVSMLITGMESKFLKKAKGMSYFHCPDGEVIRSAIEAAVESHMGQTLSVYSKGTNDKGELVAEFWFHWSFKVR